MKKRPFLPLSIALGSLFVIFMVVYFVLIGIGNDSYWTNFCLGIGIGCLVLLLFFLVLFWFEGRKLPEVKQGVVCPKCKTIYPKEARRCPKCGEKNPIPKNER